jgi:hypothetical protein
MFPDKTMTMVGVPQRALPCPELDEEMVTLREARVWIRSQSARFLRKSFQTTILISYKCVW